MTVDALELLSRLGQVDPADQAVLDAALEKLAQFAGQDAYQVRRGRRAMRPRTRLLLAAAAAALTAAASVAAVAVLKHPVPVTRTGSTPPVGQGRSDASPAGSAGSHGATPGAPTVASVLTAFRASSDDILQVTKVVRGEGECCRTIIWISPAEPSPGAAVRSRILNFTLAGTKVNDMAVTYDAGAATGAATGAGCEGIFVRPRAAIVPATGLPGRLTVVNYQSRVWASSNLRIEPATVPSAAGLRACLSTGQWRDLGPRVLAGSKEIEFASADGYESLWVDAATDLPVRLVSTTTMPTSSISITFAFKFLPPTPANQEMLTVPAAPAGFAKVGI
jgi:hypothetical protein